jgi:hypothetical protein
MSWRYEKVNNRSRLGGISVGVQGLVNDLLTRVRDIYQKLRLKLSALLSTPELPQPSEKEKPKVSSSSRSPKASRRKPVRIVKGASKK